MCQLCEVKELMEQGNLADALKRLAIWNLSLDVGATQEGAIESIEDMILIAEAKQAIIALGKVILAIVELDGQTIN